MRPLLQSQSKTKENPTLAIVYFCLAGLCVTVNLISSKVLYERFPLLGGTQLLLYRSGLSVIILAAYHNTALKLIMYD